MFCAQFCTQRENSSFYRIPNKARSRSRTQLALFLGTLLVFAVKAQAVGYRLPNQDPEAIARGNAFAATADNPSAIYYNPAGITQLEGQQISGGIYAVSAGPTHTSPTPTTTNTHSDFHPLPQLYYTCP